MSSNLPSELCYQTAVAQKTAAEFASVVAAGAAEKCVAGHLASQMQ